MKNLTKSLLVTLMPIISFTFSTNALSKTCWVISHGNDALSGRMLTNKQTGNMYNINAFHSIGLELNYEDGYICFSKEAEDKLKSKVNYNLGEQIFQERNHEPIPSKESWLKASDFF